MLYTLFRYIPKKFGAQVNFAPFKNKETGEIEEKKYRIKETDTKTFWLPIITSKSFRDFVENKYRVSMSEIISSEQDDEFVETVGVEE